MVEQKWCINDFCIGRPLGSGRFGRVYLAHERKSEYKLLVGIKIMFKSMLTKNFAELNVKSEIEIQSSLNHPNILALYTWFHDDDKIYIILEFAVNGSVLKKLDNEIRFEDKVASTVSIYIK